MASIRKAQESNFKPRPQKRNKGTGAGRKMFPWKRNLPWLLIAGEQLVIERAGSSDAVLEERQWVLIWNISPDNLASQLDQLFPGIERYLDSLTWGDTHWRKLLHNRIYKMFYNGTSARGHNHDPTTRAMMSPEHWRNWSKQLKDRWEARILKHVAHKRKYPEKVWRTWL